MNYRKKRLLSRVTNAVGSLLRLVHQEEVLYREALQSFREKNNTTRLILILCQGNICRSPFAEHQLRRILNDAGIENIIVQSAGLNTTSGKPADAGGIRTARKYALDLSGHRTTQANHEKIAAADLILVMEPSHNLLLAREFPFAKSRSILLGAFALRKGYPLVIEDPYAKSDEVFDACFTQLDFAIHGLVDILKREREMNQ